MTIKASLVIGSGATGYPINSYAPLDETDNVVASGTETWLKTGVVDDDPSAYPLATTHDYDASISTAEHAFVEGTGPADPDAIEWDGTNWCVWDRANEVLYKYDEDWSNPTIFGVWGASLPYPCYNITWAEERDEFILLSNTPAYKYTFDSDGAFVASENDSFNGGYHYEACWDGDNYWGLGRVDTVSTSKGTLTKFNDDLEWDEGDVQFRYDNTASSTPRGFTFNRLGGYFFISVGASAIDAVDKEGNLLYTITTAASSIYSMCMKDEELIIFERFGAGDYAIHYYTPDEAVGNPTAYVQNGNPIYVKIGG